MLGKIKKYYFTKYLKKNRFSRDKEIVSIAKAKHIGIIAHITDEDSYKSIYAIFSKLQSLGKTVWLMGYYDGKEVPHYCLQQLTADFFCQKQLNWYGKPQFIQMNDFLAKPFNLLIDFADQSFTPIRYILSQSHAGLIVGTNPDFQDEYDLFIKMENRTDHVEVLKNINLYLQKLSGE